MVRLISSPGDSYARELVAALERATSFVLVTGFATSAGVELIEPAIRGVLERGGQGRIVIAVDRQGFNAAAVFEALDAVRQQLGRPQTELALESWKQVVARGVTLAGDEQRKIPQPSEDSIDLSLEAAGRQVLTMGGCQAEPARSPPASAREPGRRRPSTFRASTCRNREG